MSKSCPVGIEWDEFVIGLNAINDNLTSTDALTAYNIYNSIHNLTDVIPSIDEALNILVDLSTTEKDEELIRQNNSVKIGKFQEQVSMLSVVHENFANPKQQAAIGKLIDMTENHVYNLRNEDPASTISVSRFIGSSTFKGDPTEYQAFKLFGTFVHDVLEYTQKGALEQGNISPKLVLTREFFDQRLKEYREENPFEIQSLTDDKLFLMTQDLVGQIAALKSQGYLVLPEVSVIGTDEHGTKLIGRIDMLLIDPTGKVKVYDFKTKKVKLMDDIGGDWTQDEASAACSWLALKEYHYNTKDQKEGTQLDFLTGELAKRSSYDTWALQVNIYKNILEQNDIDVSGHAILALLYETDDDKNFLGSIMHQFELENYYVYADFKTVYDKDGLNIIEKRKLDSKIDNIVRLVNKHVPSNKTQEEIVVKSTKLITEYIQPTDAEYIEMRNNIKRLVDRERVAVNTAIKNAKTIATRKILEEKRDSLTNYAMLVEKMSNEDFDKSINTATALDYLNNELSYLYDRSTELFEKFEKNPTKFNNNDLKKMSMIYKTSEGLSEIINVMKRVLNEAKDNEGNKITENSPAQLMLGVIEGNKEAINFMRSQIFRQQAVAAVLKTPGEKAFKRIGSQITEIAEKEIELLEREIEELKSGKGLTLYQQIKSKALETVSKSYKEKLGKKLDQNAPKLTLIIEKENKVEMFKKLIAGTFDFNDASVLAYLDNITDPDSNFYVGSDRLLPYNAILSNSLTNEWVASVANKDLALSGVTQFLKNAAADAVKNAQNHFASSNFDKLRDQLYKSGKSFETINSQITEKVTIKYRDPATGDLLEKEMLAIVAPYTPEYKDTFNSYKAFLKEHDFNIRQYKSERNNIFIKTDIASRERVDELTKLILDTQNARSAKVKEYNQWMINNCSLPFKDEFYEVQKELPTEIAEQLQDKYLELETYRYMQDKKTKTATEGDIEENDDDQTIDLDFERIGEIEDEIKGLREEAKDLDPKYAEYIDRLNDFYEFDIRYDYYNRQKNLAISKYANNPELMQKWLDENEITTPTKEWYNKLSDLYDQLAVYFGSDPVYHDLMEKRAKILRKHKYVDGVLRPQYMSEQDIADYDEVEAEIIAYKDARTYTELDEADVEAVDEIFFQINSLKQKEKNKYYTKEFDHRLNKLKNRWAQVTVQEATVASLITKGATTAEIDAAKDTVSKHQSQFFKEEKEFKKWYEKHHTNKYKSITKGNRVESYVSPKEYNYSTVPADAVKGKYLQTTPHPKFTKRRMKQDAYYVDDVKLDDVQKEELIADPELMAAYELDGRLRFEEGVYNKNYLESPDGIPMPKNVIKIADNVYAPKPGAGFANINPRYLDMYNDKELFEFYSAITSMFFDLQKQTDGRTLGYIVPGAAADFVQNIHASGLSAAIVKSKDIFIDKNLKAYGSAQDINDAIYGDVADSIRLKGNRQLDPLLQSKDAVSSIMQWAAEAHYNIAMQEAAPVTDAFIDELKSKSGELHRKIESGDKGVVRDIKGNVISSIDFAQRAKELDSIIALASYERNKFITGQYEDTDVNRRVTKTLKTFFSYTSMIRIGFDVTNQTKNYVAGSIQALIAACNYETGNYGTKDFLWAKAHLLGFNGTLAKYAKDLGNISDVSPETMIYRLFNPVQKEFSKYVKDTSGSMSRRALSKVLNINELAYFLQDKGDSLIGMTVMWSVLHGNKYKVIKGYEADGKPIYEKGADGDDILIPAHDCYIKDNNTNELKIRNDVEYTVDDEKFLRNIIYSEMRRAQGNYAKADQVKKEASPMGKIVLFFRKYLIPLVMNRFGYAKTNWEAGEVAIGYWRAVAMAYRQFGGMQVAKHLIVGGKTMDNMNANTMGTFLTAKVGHARRDAITMSILIALSMFALMWYKSRKEDDDEDEEKTMAKAVQDMMLGNMFRLIWQVKGETVSMVPFAEGSEQYIKNFTTGIPFVREFTAGTKFVNHALSTGYVTMAGMGEEPDEATDGVLYQEAWKNAYYSRRAGDYEKGDAKLMKDFIDLTGIRNFKDLLNPENRLQFLQSRQ